MKSISELIIENQKEAIQLMLEHGNKIDANTYEIVFCNDVENLDESFNVPYLLLENRYGGINDLAASKVRMTESLSKDKKPYYKFDVFINEWNEWIPLNYVLSNTENNVFLSIEAYAIENKYDV